MCVVVFAMARCHVVLLFSYGKLPFVQLFLSWQAVLCAVVFVTTSCHVVLLFSYGKLPYMRLFLSWQAVICAVVFITAGCHVVWMFYSRQTVMRAVVSAMVSCDVCGQ